MHSKNTLSHLAFCMMLCLIFTFGCNKKEKILEKVSGRWQMIEVREFFYNSVGDLDSSLSGPVVPGFFWTLLENGTFISNPDSAGNWSLSTNGKIDSLETCYQDTSTVQMICTKYGILGITETRMSLSARKNLPDFYIILEVLFEKI